jgi:thioredoxin 1
MCTKFVLAGLIAVSMAGVSFAGDCKDCRDQASFCEALKNEMVVVDFHGEAWCGPCRRMGPIFKSVAQKFDNVTFIKCNVDEFDIPGITSVPTFVCYKNGKEVGRFSGGMSEKELTTKIKNILGL